MRGVRIAVGVEQKVFSGILGSRIKGTSAFAAFISQNGDETSLGYLGEAFVLECTSLGLAHAGSAPISTAAHSAPL